MDDQQIQSNVNTASQPPALKITDMRIVRTQTGGPILKPVSYTHLTLPTILRV